MAIPVDTPEPGPLFLYGTLMDPDVLDLVLGRTVPSTELSLGCVSGYRRVYINGRSYPTLVKSSDPKPVRGLLFGSPRSCDIRRCNDFEGDEYEAKRLKVKASAGTVTLAWAYIAADELAGSGKEWDFAEWQAGEKEIYLALCCGWLER